jgi:predicted transcriptional regulator
LDGSPQQALSDAEREVLKVLWEQGPLGVRDVLCQLTESGQDWTRSTVVTLLHRLEAKGYIESDRSQYAFVYRPLVSREDVMHARIQDVASELADGEPIPLMLAFAERHKFSDAELARLQQMLDELRSRTRGKRGKRS